MLQIEALDHSSQQSLAAQILQLRVEICRVIGRTVDYDRTVLATTAGRIVFQINLDARISRENVRLPYLINGGEGRNYQGQTDNQPQVFAYGPQILFEVIFIGAFGIPVTLIVAVPVPVAVPVAVSHSACWQGISIVRHLDESVL